MTEEEINKYMKEREASTRARLLEIIGDIPDADVKPPENVLFVCKLNPITTDEDLELIFSRFGKINSCEVIRDRKTGDSLCYAFIDYDREEDCENAFFKMDNVLIDDRRIHVDFSQSVAKVNWKGKGTGTGFFEDNRNYQNKSNKFEDDERKDRPQYKVTNKSRKGHGYSLVFDEEETSNHNKYEPIKREYIKKDQYRHREERHRADDDDRNEKRDRDSYRKRDDHSSDKKRDSGRYEEKSRSSSSSTQRDRDYDRDRDRDREHRHHDEKHRNSERHDRSSSSKSSRNDEHKKTSSSSSSRR